MQILLPAGRVCAETGISLPDQYAKTNNLPDPDFTTAPGIDKYNLNETEKKLSTSLLLDAQDSGDPGAVKLFASSASVETSSDEPVYVYVYVLPGYSTHIIDHIADVTGRDEENNFAVAWVDTGDLYELAAIEGVRTVREAIAPGLSVGSVTTEGDIVHKTANVRSEYGYTGKGVKIGIISNGVNHINDSQKSGDLPDDVHVLSDDVGGDEGTAMLEIVHDMVPDAELYFHDMGDDEIGFNDAIDALVSSGCKVICDDIYWPGQPYFEDGSISSHLESVLSDNDIVYVAAATNLAEVHYQGEFYSSTNGFHDFSSGTNPNRTSMYVCLPAASGVRIILQWNDKFGSSDNDYDLYLSKISNSSSEIEYGDLDYSVDTQDGSGDPMEYIEYYNPCSSEIIGEIDVRKNGSAESRILELFILPQDGANVYNNNVVAADSVFGHAAVPDVITTAAVNWITPSTIESYSSRGPVTISYPTPEIRAKPDITGVDNVSITGAGGFTNPFSGTSAAAPHVAAVAAQIWGAYPGMTADEVKAALYNSTVDLGTTGKDTTFGYGRADALAMADSLRTVVSSGLNVATGRSGGGPNTDTGMGFATDLKAGETASFTMDKGAVREVSVTAGTDIKKVMITVQKDGSLPSSIEEPDTDVYEYEDVTVYYADGSDLSGGTFEFKVKKSWLSANGYGSGDIVMLHYNEETGEWKELETTLTDEDGSYYYYTAETPSFSWFAIAAAEGSTIVPGETQTAEATLAATQFATASVTPSPSSAATVLLTAIPANPGNSGGTGSWSSLAIPAVFMILVVIVIVGLACRRKKEQYPDWWDKEFK
ncbi:PGF-pre-PGF domain-containing protein [Methanolacinia paynteri]|uniref:PGF-pre-PGF domain-containing protein n=1 Tax=Methanolacinia paynteri TaxID=230356 RepID=UPI000ACFE0EB|nr:PGF-pre-PGF domain-containing protein [Methanolacinia paynteri]